MNTLTLWHGGRDLEYEYKKATPAKGLWEHGPGLYLTSSYERARSYAKGGGTTYQVSLQEGINIHDVKIPIEQISCFVSEHVIKSKRTELLEDIHSNMKRMNTLSVMNAEYFLNLVINLEAIKKTNTDKLCQFLVESGADYGIVKHYGGSAETVFVVFNRSKIASVKKIAAKDVSLNEYDLDCTFKLNEVVNKMKL